MPSYLWTILYIIIIIWLITSTLAYLIQWLLQRYAGVTVKIGRTGIFSCRKVQILVKKGLKLEIEKAWLSSCFVNQEQRKPLVICISDIRIQADVRKDGQDIPSDSATPPGAPDPNQPNSNRGEDNKKVTLPKIAYYLQYMGLRMNNMTLMLLNTMIPDCLVHVEGQSLSLDISMVDNCYEFTMDVVGVSCRALRSVSEEQQQIEPCLAEMSCSTFVHLQAHKDNIKQFKMIRLLMSKPQAKMTEALFSSIQAMRTMSASQMENTDNITNTRSSLNLSLIPQEIGLDVTDLDVKIVRQNIQRTLSVGLKNFHMEFQNNTNTSEEEQSICGLLVEDFHTESPQAKFAALLKANVKVELNKNKVESDVAVQGAFFNYHHEEIQYWSSVVTRVSDTRTGLSGQIQSNRIASSSPLKTVAIDYCRRRHVCLSVSLTEISSSLSSAAYSGLHLVVHSAKVISSISPSITAESSDLPWLDSVSCKVEVQTVSCQHMDARVTMDRLQDNTHFWDHALYIGTFYLKGEKRCGDLVLDVELCNTHIEWSTLTVNTALYFLGALLWKQQSGANSVSMPTEMDRTLNIPPSNLQPAESNISVKMCVSNVNLFLCNNHKVCLMSRIDSVDIDLNTQTNCVTVEGCKVIYTSQVDKSMVLVSSSQLHNPAIHVQEVRVTHSREQNEMHVRILKILSCEWKTCHHMCLIQGLEDVKEIKARYQAFQPQVADTPADSYPPQQKVKVNVIVEAATSFTLCLSKEHSVTFVLLGFIMTRSEDETLMEIERFTVNCDKHQIFVLEGTMIGTLSKYHLREGRQSVGNLKCPTNRAWHVLFNSFEIVFPYKYNFAKCFEEFVNLWKWWKLAHKVKKKPFTEDSLLPPDLQIKVKRFQVQLSDDPFEVKLGDNYELMKDECYEYFKRKAVMEQKVQNLRRTHGFIPADRVQELFDSLDKKSSDIYLQRSRLLYTTTPMRTKLFTWLMEDVEILAYADKSFHGKENVVKQMKDIDNQSPYPEEGLEFVTLWCRYVNFNLSLWKVVMRDYLHPMLEVKDMGLWGRLIGAEQDGSKRAKRKCVVEVEDPWGNMEVERNLPTLKFYHDFNCDVKSWVMAYGACWEPAIAQYNISLDLINKPSVDPSRPLPIWDKIRLLLHGRFFMSVEQMSWLYHASFDPYNTTEFMDWSWSKVCLDWTNANFVLLGDFDISARTTSKYDDCKLLHLPNLKLVCKLEWLCHGDPNDHHAVMPCAPDKVPDFSHEEHDSFRAFRSKNLNLAISLDTKPLRENTLNVPSCLFYASTLRFLDKIKMCFANVTRPIRRGSLFNVIKPRKPQLTRHYKTIKTSVNLHRFNICYWMSFSKQLGSELLADSFVLSLCNDLTLTPVEDGLFHRPLATWSVRYLHCQLTGAKTWLCSARRQTEDQLNVSLRNPVDKNFFLSVGRVSYQRGDNTSTSYEEDSDEEEEEAEAEKRFNKATHSVQVHDLKGAWTKHNRTVLLGVLDSYTKAQSLKRNLSADALKKFKVDGGQGPNKTRSMSLTAGAPGSPTNTNPSPGSYKLGGVHTHSLLMKLVSESDSKSVAFTEEPSNMNMEQLHGVAACQTDDVYCKNWLIELHNSQMMVKGCETSGYVIVSAAKAQIVSCTHQPVWQDNQLRSKTSWVTSVECMQYYATVDPDNHLDDDTMAWLHPENVEDRSEPELSGMSEMVGSGSSVGGVVYSTVGGTKESKKSPKASVQLQRIISRCKCQVFFASYGDVDDETLPEIPPPPSEDSSDMMSREEGVDCFTLLHHDLNVCTNSLQYAMILDIVNNLLLHVEKTKKETTEKLQSMRFQLQLSREEDQKTPIQQLQEYVRENVLNLRRLERELYLIEKELEDNEDSSLLEQSEKLEMMLYDCKERINSSNEELSIRISCLKESQLQVKSQMKTTKTHQARVDKRHEVCFKFAHWRLTEADGQLGVSDLALRNFVYTKVNRDNDTWTHQLELGWIKMTNLLPNAIYKDVIVPLHPIGNEGDNRQMAIRILCSEKPPVGGIAVKEHFEVNVVPMQIQLTHHFFKTMMAFFFPDKDIEEDAHDDVSDGASLSSQKKKLDRKPSGRKDKDSLKKSASFSSENDIDKMKERAAKNNTFIYIKIPEVSLRVSYKGMKEKNLKDIHDFNLVLPTLEYHNQIWTWYDLLMQMQGDSKRVVLSQAIKQKLHMRGRGGEETPLTDVQQEEDKMKMLLGAKLLSGKDKPVKKTIFGKTPKQ
ncbi:protein hobbit-like isoform X1 [Argopecten irradians]|uniref:protein hobbit-like isoform X1 n=1 Tax=Argopecten irradians TaxID=31199 RepID=UPI00371625A4